LIAWYSLKVLCMGVGMPARKTVEEVLQLSLDSFLEQERARLIEFERQWREGMAAKPMYFPKAMDAGSPTAHREAETAKAHRG